MGAPRVRPGGATRRRSESPLLDRRRTTDACVAKTGLPAAACAAVVLLLVVPAGNRDVYYTQSKDGRYVYAFLTKFTDNDPRGNTQWGRLSRKDIVLKQLKATPTTAIRVLGQEHRVERFTSRHAIGSRFKRTDDGLEISVVRAQPLYNNRRWPNAVVVRLENVEFAKQQGNA